MNKNIIQKKMMNSIHLRETADGIAEKCINSNLRDYQIFGNTVQDGEPAIDNPVEVVSVGELVNFINVSQCEDGTIMSHNGQVALIPNRVRTGYIYLKKGSYCLSTIGTENDIIFGGYCHKYSSKDTTTWLGAISCSNNIFTGERNYKTFTLDEDCYCRFVLLPASTSSITNFSINNISNYKPQLEVGDIPTLYKPYGIVKIPITTTNENGDSLTTNIYLSEPLHKIGDYQDYIDFRNRCVIRNCAFQKFNSAQDWMLGNSNSVGNIMYYKLSKNRLGVVDGKANALLNNCKAVSSSVMTPPANLAPMSVVYGGGNNYMYVFVGNEIASTISEWKTWLDNNDMHIVYVLSSPTIEDIELPKLPQFKGTTIYQIATNIPSEFVGTYKTRL